jgi:hypothetical protein
MAAKGIATTMEEFRLFYCWRFLPDSWAMTPATREPAGLSPNAINGK